MILTYPSKLPRHPPNIQKLRKRSSSIFIAVQMRVWQLKRWPCHWVTKPIFWFWNMRQTWDMTRPKNTYLPTHPPTCLYTSIWEHPRSNPRLVTLDIFDQLSLNNSYLSFTLLRRKITVSLTRLYCVFSWKVKFANILFLSITESFQKKIVHWSKASPD